MRIFDINITTYDTFIGKLCISREIYDTMSDTNLAICINNFFSELDASIGVTVCHKDIQLHACTNQFIRVSINNKNVWIMYGIKEPEYNLTERINSIEY